APSRQENSGVSRWYTPTVTLTMLPRMPKQRSPGLRVLLLDENPRDADLVSHALRTAHPGCSVLRVDNEPAFREALSAFDPDVVLCDPAATRFHAFDALRMVMARSPGVAFLLVGDTFDEAALRCLRKGAADFGSRTCPGSARPSEQLWRCARRSERSPSASGKCCNCSLPGPQRVRSRSAWACR